MKKFVLLFCLACLSPSFILASPTDVKPHYQLLEPDLWRYLHINGLPLENSKNVKSYTEIVPVNEGDMEAEKGEIRVYNYNRNGLLTDGSKRYGDMAGGYDFKINYNEWGRPSKIIWTSHAPVEIGFAPEQWVVTEYVPLYDGSGRIRQMRETTTKVGDKKVNAVNKYMVEPGPSGAPAKVVSLDDNSLKVNFDQKGNLADSWIFAYDPTGQDWVMQTLTENSPLEMEFPADADVELDKKGNWIKKSFNTTLSDGSEGSTGMLRRITYF